MNEPIMRELKHKYKSLFNTYNNPELEKEIAEWRQLALERKIELETANSFAEKAVNRYSQKTTNPQNNSYFVDLFTNFWKSMQKSLKKVKNPFIKVIGQEEKNNILNDANNINDENMDKKLKKQKDEEKNKQLEKELNAAEQIDNELNKDEQNNDNELDKNKKNNDKKDNDEKTQELALVPEDEKPGTELYIKKQNLLKINQNIDINKNEPDPKKAMEDLQINLNKLAAAYYMAHDGDMAGFSQYADNLFGKIDLKLPELRDYFISQTTFTKIETADDNDNFHTYAVAGKNKQDIVRDGMRLFYNTHAGYGISEININNIFVDNSGDGFVHGPDGRVFSYQEERPFEKLKQNERMSM